MKTKSAPAESMEKPRLYKKGKINGVPYIVIGIQKKDDGSGYCLKFINKDPKDPNGKTVGNVFVPGPLAKTLGRGLLDQIRDEEIL